ncbi:MAG: hypothetical protein KatS3mg115_1801 [Candidatus Poribacteria bacterium]|nr:MAG: hypothetical protein KatS3mg115_1801 [Candidatus Poribacteria bacterium]
MSVRACPQARVASKVSPALWREIVVYFWLFLFAGLGGILLVSNWPEAIARLTVGFGAFTALFWKGRPLRARLWASGGFLLGAMPVVALAALERSLVWALLWAGTALLAVVLAWGFDLTVGLLGVSGPLVRSAGRPADSVGVEGVEPPGLVCGPHRSGSGADPMARAGWCSGGRSLVPVGGRSL